MAAAVQRTSSRLLVAACKTVSTSRLSPLWSQVKEEEQEAAKLTAVFPCVLKVGGQGVTRPP
jgi:hypothetical protein